MATTPPSDSPSVRAVSTAARILAAVAASGQRTSLAATASMSTSAGAYGPHATSPMRSTHEWTVTPSSASSALATPPAATRAAVSRALARSRTSRASVLPMRSQPARSACPGRGAVTAPPSVRSPATAMTSVQLALSRLAIVIATGLPMVAPKRTPETISARSDSMAILPPRP